jgi:predicted transcriptional regulator YheO
MYPMPEKEWYLSNLCDIARAVVSMFGRNCEACVHDLTSLPNSLVYIHGDVTHRQPGAPATDLLLKIVNKHNESGNVFKYQTQSSDGRSLKSTTTLVRDQEGRPFAALCINFDTTEFYNASQAILPFIEYKTEDEAVANTETFTHSVEDTLTALFDGAVKEIGKHPTSMTSAERRRLVLLLDTDGSFQFKGAVEHIAKLMGVTRYTIYNYLKKIRQETTLNMG